MSSSALRSGTGSRSEKYKTLGRPERYQPAQRLAVAVAMRCRQDKSLRGWSHDRFVSHIEYDFNFFGFTSSETQ